MPHQTNPLVPIDKTNYQLAIQDISILNWYVQTHSDPANDDLIARHRGRPGALLGILEAVQERNPRKYLCQDELRYIAAKTNLPLAQIFSVATFYALFNLEPQGDHTICICRGTAASRTTSADCRPVTTLSSRPSRTTPAAP